ncbi:MAG: hypothetical protein ACOH1E_11030 [Brevundimonas sp.]
MRLSRRGVLAALPLALLAARPTSAFQADPLTARQLLREQGRYLPRWIELLDEPAERARVLTMLGPDQAQAVDWVLRDGITQYASFLGDEATALREASRSVTTPDPEADLIAEDALAAIVEASRGHRVVMLNEAHVASRHRAFLGRLIVALRGEGFTHLAAETFAEGVGELRAGYPLSFRHGWYLGDPVYAEAVRQALDLGYRMIAYEQREDQRSGELSLSDAATLTREQVQADNLKAAMAADPDMRVLVFVGYGHLTEDGPAFGARFKADTGIDPLTIGQSETGSFGPHVEDAPPVLALLERFRPTQPVLILKAGTRPASAASVEALTVEKTDLLLMHPSLPDIDGRPAWLAQDPARRRLEVAVPAGAGPRLLQAVHAADPDPAIPADQMLIDDAGGAAVLFLRPGLYRIRLETPAGFVPLEQRVAV